MPSIPVISAEIVDLTSFVPVISAELTVLSGGVAETYDGEYVIQAALEEDVVLSTMGKRMKDDIMVRQVEHHAVSNESGGKTFYIG